MMMNDSILLSANNNDVGTRIDVFISSCLNNITRSTIQKQIEIGSILVNDRSVAKNYKLKADDKIIINPVQPMVIEAIPQDIPINIVYEDQHMLVVNKAKGMVVHPANGNNDGTLVNALMFHCKDLSGINGVIRPGIVHRIDKNTSGLLVVAKSDIAHVSLANQIREHSFLREYQAVVYGNVKDDFGTINLPIGRHHTERKKMCVTEKNSRDATTNFSVIERYNGFTHLSLKLHTGRTHQIRVHLAYMGNPVAGDDVYGPKNVIKKLMGQCLHAKTIGFVHPTTGENMFFDSELPDNFKQFLLSIKK